MEPLGALLRSLGALLEPLGGVSGASWEAFGGYLEAMFELGMRL